MSEVVLPPLVDRRGLQTPARAVRTWPERQSSRTPPLRSRTTYPQEQPDTQTTQVAPTPPLHEREGSRTPPFVAQRRRRLSQLGLGRTEKCSSETPQQRSLSSSPCEQEKAQTPPQVAPTPPPHERRSSRTPAEVAQRRRSLSQAGSGQTERCSMCSKEEMWEVYDVFQLLDRRRQNKIVRRDFYDALKDCTSLQQLKVLNRSRLKDRFLDSAQDVTLEEFLRMMWPTAPEEDLHKMIYWSRLREAQHLLHGVVPHTMSTNNLRMIFHLLDLNGDQKVSVEELYRANILTPEQVEKLMVVAEKQYEAFQAKALAAAALFGKQIEDSSSFGLGRLGGPKFDGKLAFRDFCKAVKSGIPAE